MIKQGTYFLVVPLVAALCGLALLLPMSFATAADTTGRGNHNQTNTTVDLSNLSKINVKTLTTAERDSLLQQLTVLLQQLVSQLATLQGKGYVSPSLPKGSGVLDVAKGTTTPPPATFTVSPASGAAPLGVTVTWWGGKCDGYVIDWGDGDTINQAAPSGAGACIAIAVGYTKTHTYTKAGTYTVRLTVNGGQAKTQTVTVTGGSAVADDFSISPTSGTAPMIVTAKFTADPCDAYVIRWGDGYQNYHPSKNCSSAEGTKTAITESHIYTNYVGNDAKNYQVRYEPAIGNTVLKTVNLTKPAEKTITQLSDFPAAGVALVAEPSRVPSGGSVTLRWATATVVGVCTASGDWSGSKAVPNIASRTEKISNITSNKVFTISCKGARGDTVESTARVTVDNNIVGALTEVRLTNQ